MAQEIGLKLAIQAPADADAEEIAVLTTRLRDELLELDVRETEPARTPAPPGSKAVDPTVLGQLSVALAPGVLGGLTKLVLSWVGRQTQTSVKLQCGDDLLELHGNPTSEQRQLLQDFLDRHGSG